MDDPILDALAMVLAPMPEDQRDALLKLARQEIDTRPIVGYCWDGVTPPPVDAEGNVTGPWAYEVGQPSPIFPTRTTFAMFHWEEQNCVAAFTFEQIEAGGRTGVQFYRELIFNPKHVSGPLKPQALFNELVAFMAGPDDDPGGGGDDGIGHANGEARA